LKERFGEDEVNVVGKSNFWVTGNFEITVDGELIHSKRRNGHKFLHNDKEQEEAVLAAIGRSLGSASIMEREQTLANVNVKEAAVTDVEVNVIDPVPESSPEPDQKSEDMQSSPADCGEG